MNHIPFTTGTMLRKLAFLSFSVLCVLAQHHEDKRCRCVCPSPAAVINDTLSKDRKLFIANVHPNQCNCDGVILPRIGDEIRGREMQYCPRCECKYETRNSTVIMVVVVFVLLALFVLVGYIAFLMCLKTIIGNKIKSYKDPSEESRSLLVGGEAAED